MFINKENLEKHRDENIKALNFDLELFHCLKMRCKHCIFADLEYNMCKNEGIPFDTKVDILLNKPINLEEEI